jgi:ssRNA-specific RNase YbeY (16S rRNA maturation enzyme)
MPSQIFATSSLLLLIMFPFSAAWVVQLRHRALIKPVHRLFGSKAGIAGNPPGTIYVHNDQISLPGINIDRIYETVSKIRQEIGYETYDMTLILLDDEDMQETNLETRGIDAPTDILSFPFHQAIKPGLLEKPEFDVPDYYNLGDCLVDIPYVQRRCAEDMEYNEGNGEIDSIGKEDERGVSGAMSHVYDAEDRINMLLVHGMLHLVGYDHESDDEFEEMVQREEEVLEAIGLVGEQ